MPTVPFLGAYGDLSGSGLMFRNKIINGGMVIDQRNAGAKITTSAYGMDRFAINQTVTGKLGLQQVADAPSGLSYCASVTVEASYSVTASDFYGLVQVIEGYNIADLAWGTSSAKPVTLSFWAKASTTGTYGGALFNESGTRRTYAFTYTISAANTWEYKTVTIPGCPDGTWTTTTAGGIYVNFACGIGSNAQTTAGSWASGAFRGPSGVVQLVGLANGQNLRITGVQLEVGAQATPFEQRPIGIELALCQRYCITYGGDNNYNEFGLGFATSATAAQIHINLPQKMRAVPDVSTTGSFQLSDGLVGYSSSGISTTAVQNSTQVMTLNVVSSSLTTYRPLRLEAFSSTGSKITYSAEI